MGKLFTEPPVVGAMRAASAVSRRLPEPALPAVEKVAGRLAAAGLTGRRRQVERNIRRIYGSQVAPSVVDRIVRETFTSYARYWIESLRLPGTSPEALDAGVTITGFEHVTAGLEQGKGVIVALPHLGGWEWAAFWLAVTRSTPMSAVVEALEPPELSEWFLSLRESMGMQIHPLGPNAGTASVQALKNNRVLALVSDRDLNQDGIEVPFFGEKTTLPGGPATLALRTGAPLLSAATYFDGRRHRFVVEEPLDTARRGRLRDDVTRVTTDLAGRLENLIRQAPEQWHMLQPNWPSDRTA